MITQAARIMAQAQINRDAASANETAIESARPQDAMERAAQVYGFVTMPDPVTLFPRQMEVIESIADALVADRETSARIEAQARIYNIALLAIEALTIGKNDLLSATARRIINNALAAAQAFEVAPLNTP